jgi:uncharacterized protein
VRDRIKLSGILRKEGNNLHLRGAVKLTLHTLCSRCGQEMDYLIDSEFDLVLMQGTERYTEIEKMLTPDDFNHSYFQGPELDLTPYFQEQIALEVPIQFLCRQDCKGICPGCGCNLNEEDCRCIREEGDPRLAVLRKLKVQK